MTTPRWFRRTVRSTADAAGAALKSRHSVGGGNTNVEPFSKSGLPWVDCSGV